MSNCTDPRTCSACGVDLYENILDVGWNHLDENFKPYRNGCKFDGLFACAGRCTCANPNRAMLGPFKSEQESKR